MDDLFYIFLGAIFGATISFVLCFNLYDKSLNEYICENKGGIYSHNVCVAKDNFIDLKEV